MRHREATRSIGAYLLGALPDGERGAFEAHLAECERCREEVARLRPAADALPVSVTPLDPPPELWARVMAAVAAEPAGGAAPAAEAEALEEPAARLAPEPVSRRDVREPWWRRLGGGGPAPRWCALAAGTAVAAVLGVGVALGLVLGGGGGDDGGGGTRTFAAEGMAGARAASGELVTYGGRAGGVLRVAGMPRLEPGRVYEVWLARDGEVTGSALFSVNADGSGSAGIDRSLEGVDKVLVTQEDSGGSPTGQPTAKPVLGATLGAALKS